MNRLLQVLVVGLVALLGVMKVYAQTPVETGTVRTTPVGFPQDAAPHDSSAIEWWYYNAFLTTESGKKYAVVCSFFRTGLTPQSKGHYLIYSLTDLETKKTVTASILDKANRDLLKVFMPLAVLQRPGDANLAQLAAALRKDTLPEPHRGLATNAVVTTTPRFSIAFEKNTLAQKTDDARTWSATLSDAAFSLDLTMTQPDRPAMLVGGEGKTGLTRPDDMFYVSLTNLQSSGTLTVGGKTEKVTGVGWLDRQWGTSWIVQDNGWDWFGAHLSDGSDVIVYRVKDNKTGKILRSEATILRADGTQIVDKNPVFTVRGDWMEVKSGIVYPDVFTVALPSTGQTLTFTPAFSEQTIPVVGIGEAIWEGVVLVTGTDKAGKEITGQGYRELVGYRAKVARTPTAEGKQEK